MDTEQKIKELLNNTNAYDYTKKIYDKNKEKEIEEQLKIVRKKVENTIFEMIQNGEFTRTIKDLGKEWYSKTNDLIYEPFAGVCTGSVTANKLGRQFIAVEKEEEYACLGQKRINLAQLNNRIQGYEDGIFRDKN